MIFSGMFKNPKDSTQKRIQIDSSFGVMSINLYLVFVAWILMKFSGMVYCLITNHFCEFQFKNQKDSTQNRIQIDSFLGVMSINLYLVFGRIL
ncbi:hypothetical protein BLOT_013185, partial [Blomia tropicalis]